MTGEEGAPAATTEVEKEESENGECVCVRASVGYIGRELEGL